MLRDRKHGRGEGRRKVLGKVGLRVQARGRRRRKKEGPGCYRERGKEEGKKERKRRRNMLWLLTRKEGTRREKKRNREKKFWKAGAIPFQAGFLIGSTSRNPFQWKLNYLRSLTSLRFLTKNKI
jgi:hypothetical protein